MTSLPPRLPITVSALPQPSTVSVHPYLETRKNVPPAEQLSLRPGTKGIRLNPERGGDPYHNGVVGIWGTEPLGKMPLGLIMRSKRAPYDYLLP